MMVYGTAKKPATDPAANMAAGTATNVYAVYKSPPNRNHVIHVPNVRPPRPHSSRLSRCSPRRQFDAQNPSTVTTRNRTTSTTNAGTLIPPFIGATVHRAAGRVG